ncbi:carotenoid biosynthesis protein, partial [Candidatus Microgenomates bacterium]|nr:carotenoid biosynthesis protein [Candidatus Microgenomates bacterium]
MRVWHESGKKWLRTLSLLIAFGLVVVGFFMTHVPLTEKYAGISSIAVLVFAWPAYYSITRSIGVRRGLPLLAVLTLYALLIETVALRTGFPYGNFIYTGKIGVKLFGVTPWTVAFAWPPLAIGSYAAATHLTPKKSARAAIATFLLVMADMVIDPASVSLGFWKYVRGGFFYGVPLSNFLGWIGTGFIGVLILSRFLSSHKPWPRSYTSS